MILDSAMVLRTQVHLCIFLVLIIDKALPGSPQGKKSPSPKQLGAGTVNVLQSLKRVDVKDSGTLGGSCSFTCLYS